MLNLDLAPCDNGVSWLELCMCFLLSHDCTHICVRTAFAAVTAQQELTEFRRLCRHELQHMFHASDHTLFGPTDRKDARLKHLGFSSPVACIRAMPVWSGEMWQAVIRKCLLLRGANLADACLISGDGKWLPYIRLNLKRTLPWKCRGPCADGPGQYGGWRGYCPACGDELNLTTPC